MKSLSGTAPARRPPWVPALILLLASTTPAAGQQAAPLGASTDTSTIFVSRLKAQPVDDEIKLTWVDSPDLVGTCVVYRSSEEITTRTLPKASVIGTVATGVGSFMDTPPGKKGWYYAVLIRDTGGTLYPVLVQFRNKTSTPVSPQTVAPEERLAARVTEIRAVPAAQGDSIEVTFVSSNPERDLLLFWGPEQFLRSEDLLKATRTLPLDPGTSSYPLSVLPGIDYWFAVLDAGMFKLGQAPLVPASNATTYPVQLPVKTPHGLPSAAPPSPRGIPLPSLAISKGVQNGHDIGGTDIPDLPRPAPVSAATQKALNTLASQLPAVRIDSQQPRVLDSDATPTPGGEQARLQEIVRGSFLQGDMTSSETKLLDFLSLPRKPDLANRAHYYLGQVYFFEGRFRESLLELISAEESFYVETQPWLDACFQKLEQSDK